MPRTSSDRRDTYMTTINQTVIDMCALIRQAYHGYNGGDPRYVHNKIDLWVWRNPAYKKLPIRYRAEVRGYFMGYQNAKQDNGD